MFGDTNKQLGKWATRDMHRINSGLDSGPLILFEKKTDDTLVITSFR